MAARLSAPPARARGAWWCWSSPLPPTRPRLLELKEELSELNTEKPPLDRSPEIFQRKQSCTWLMVTHQLCTTKDVLTALQKAAADAIFKFEPFVLHVQCQDLQDAQLLHTVAIEAGFRNSGITVSRKGKIMMAVRSTHCLEVPLTQKGRLMVSEEYVDFVVQVANRKMEENGKRIDRFYSSLKFALENKNHSKSSPSEEKEKGNGMDSCGRKKSQATKKDGRSPSSDKNQSLESEDSSQSNTNIFH
ncbi:tRNA wybutosine-synthesizing protein 3 homolog isoform X4 [Python bivittatus]|uniref:tRNA wybutosine-synthesizing protein 3 homolog n=1 Tax=Python bivittatus TaxID=176946 RepID=A0A9F5N3S6_PYTBI|nr:tRNA wybutosine-synthesizing protein 3 homolog isoform X4 [Python bivittatus]